MVHWYTRPTDTLELTYIDVPVLLVCLKKNVGLYAKTSSLR